MMDNRPVVWHPGIVLATQGLVLFSKMHYRESMAQFNLCISKQRYPFDNFCQSSALAKLVWQEIHHHEHDYWTAGGLRSQICSINLPAEMSLND